MSDSNIPETTYDRLRHVFFRFLKLPVDAIDYSTVHIEHFLHDVKIKIKTVYDEENKDFHNWVQEEKENIRHLKDALNNHDRFERDAVHQDSNTQEYIITAPENIKPELKELAKIHELSKGDQAGEDTGGVVNKNQVINQILDKIEEKTAGNKDVAQPPAA